MLRISFGMLLAFCLFFTSTLYADFHPPVPHEHAVSHEHDGFGEHSHRISHSNHDKWESHSLEFILNGISHDLIAHKHTHPLTHSHSGVGSHTHHAEHSHVSGGGEHPFYFDDINHTQDELKAIETGIPVGAEGSTGVTRSRVSVSNPPITSGVSGASEDSPVSEGPEASEPPQPKVSRAVVSIREITVAPIVIADEGLTESIPVIIPLFVTEYMEADLGSRVSQWVELYNPNDIDVDIEGYTFGYVVYKRFKPVKKFLTLESFVIPAGKAIILAGKETSIFGDLREDSVYVLDLDFDFTRGWLIQDADGNDIHRIGHHWRNEEHPDLGNPIRLFEDGHRKSYQIYPNTDSTYSGYYGDRDDRGNPTYHSFVETVPEAPSIPYRRKLTGMWATLKQR